MHDPNDRQTRVIYFVLFGTVTLAIGVRFYIHSREARRAGLRAFLLQYSIRTRGGKSKIRNERSRAADCHECDLTDEIFISGENN